jgi:predicted AlkP superfamily phosphohydrolase/phosphomutase
MRGAVLRYYQRVEEGIGRFLAAAGDGADLCVLSDHGFGPLHTDVFLNRALADWGLLKPLSLASELVHKPLWKRAAKKVVPDAARTWLRLHVKASPLGNPLGFVDWQNTRAFYASVSGRSVYVNLKGRQPHGTVEPGAEYEDLRTEIIERILSLRDPETGDPVAKAVFRREEVYSGPHLNAAPDLLIQEDGRYAYRVDWSETLFAPASQYGIPKTGSHRPDGILALSGPSFRSARLDGARLEDITPTLLATLGLPSGQEMDGRILAEAFTSPPSMDTAPYAQLRGGHLDGLSDEDEAAVADRLKGLGYM